jgi:hypothetical protein
MNRTQSILSGAVLASVVMPVAAFAQNCANAARLEGSVLDPSGAVIDGARIQVVGGASTSTNGAGRYGLPCLRPGTLHLTASADGFALAQATVRMQAGETEHIDFHLKIPKVETDVAVGESDVTRLDADQGIGTHTLTQKDIGQLADDPDDFKRELQVLAAANGGAPGQAPITVDGFQNSSALPPKTSIARIVTAPDLFSAEYVAPPYAGGRVEIFTKPGGDSLHGAVFLTDSDGAFNATDPFSTVATPASKHRYGFELGGPIVKTKSDFFLALEKRDINEFNIVNATALDSNESQVSLRQTVPAPQHLWIASARGDWQVTKSDVLAISFSVDTNGLSNQGVGGLVVEDAGYDSTVSEYDLRLTNTQTVSNNLLHETHAAWTWKDAAQAPLSTAPSLNVAGFFEGGGSTAQQLNDRERNLEVDEDILYSHRHSIWKVGAQALGIFVHHTDPNTFNGAYTFCGGTAPVLDANGNLTGETTTISALEQYRRVVLSLPGGTPTTFQITAGTALVPLTQWQLALYAEYTMKVNSRVILSGGLRYVLQTSPGSYANFAPRTGIAWALDKRGKTVVHLHAGLFSSVVPDSVATEVYRLNGSHQRESLIYFPSFTAPLVPTGQSLDVTTVRALPATSVTQVPSFQSAAGIEHDFPHHWHAEANVYYAESWSQIRSRNINAPLLASSKNTAPDLAAALAAPRPITPNENIFQYEATGHLSGDAVFLGLDQHSYKRFAFSLGYLYFNFTADTPNNEGFGQSAYSNKGETGPPDWQTRNRIFFFGNLNLPKKAELSAQMDVQIGQPYNVTTGTDDNGDGIFNDRPSFATSSGPGVYATHFGLLSSNTVNGDVPRDLGTMPALVHLDMNLSRAWKIGPKKADSPRTLTLNIRSANLLNHTNVTAVSSVVSSPDFAHPVAAEIARRIELGARFSF